MTSHTKTLIIAVSVLSIKFCLSQIPDFPYDSVTNEIIYRDKVELENIGKSELYKRAKLYFIDAFVDSKEVLRLDDSLQGKLVGRGILYCYYNYTNEDTVIPVKTKITVSVMIQVKNGKYRYEIYNIEIGESTLEFTATSFNENRCKSDAKNSFPSWSNEKIEASCRNSKYNHYTMLESIHNKLQSLKFNITEGMEKKSGDDDW